jgi:hypothetical protein
VVVVVVVVVLFLYADKYRIHSVLIHFILFLYIYFFH